jgi:hypothetical protein
MRHRMGSDLGQAHFYPRYETHPAPFDLSAPMDAAFGDLPTSWGEAPLRPDRIRRDLAEARRRDHRLLLYWSWRGHERSGDGFHVRPHAARIRDALADR